MDDDLASFVTVLKQARGAEVLDWDESEVRTAIEWAVYFEKRFGGGVALAPDARVAIEALLARLSAAAGLTVVLSVTRLSRATELLLFAVIRGAHLSVHPEAAWLVEALLIACMQSASTTQRGHKRRRPADAAAVCDGDDSAERSTRARLALFRAPVIGDGGNDGGDLPPLADALATHVALGAALAGAQECGAALNPRNAVPLDVVRGQSIATVLNRALLRLARLHVGREARANGCGAEAKSRDGDGDGGNALRRALDALRTQCADDTSGRCASVLCWQLLALYDEESDASAAMATAGHEAAAKTVAEMAAGAHAEAAMEAKARRLLCTELDASVAGLLGAAAAAAPHARHAGGRRRDCLRLVHPSLWPRLAQHSAAIATAYTARVVADCVATVRRGEGGSGGGDAAADAEKADADEAEGTDPAMPPLFADCSDGAGRYIAKPDYRYTSCESFSQVDSPPLTYSSPTRATGAQVRTARSRRLLHASSTSRATRRRCVLSCCARRALRRYSRCTPASRRRCAPLPHSRRGSVRTTYRLLSLTTCKTTYLPRGSSKYLR